MYYRKSMLAVAVFIVVSLGASVVVAQTFGVKKKRPKPYEFGNVVINNFSKWENISPVVFKHWLHRSKYTCRVCHVDIGFAMRAQETRITEADNRMGMYCGACHNGQVAFGPEGKDIDGTPLKNCEKCHSYGQDVQFKHNFLDFRIRMPRERFGNGIDWLKAEEEGLVKLKDFVEGVSIPRKKLKEPKNIEIMSKELNMPDIVFSHEKHTKWNGCELCHPEIFGVKKGAQPYSMQEIFDGKYCGLCHGPVAFPNIDCQRCHSKDVW